MPQLPDKDRASLQQSAEKHADEILVRLKAARKTREGALRQHPKRTVMRIEVAHLNLMSASASTAPTATATIETAGYLIAIGDSWFDYPIHDVLIKLDDHFGYNIESSAQHGDPIEAMVSHVGQLDRFARKLDKVARLGTVPKAILVSGGGDDIAGTEFGMLINNIDLPNAGWNEEIVAGVVAQRVAGAYRTMFLKVNALCKKILNRTFPILIHGYDYPVPDGRGFLGGWGPLPGPWLKSGFDEKLFIDLNQTTQMMAGLIDRFNAMLQALIQEPGFENVRYVDVRHALSNRAADYKAWWANELHPTGDVLFGDKDGFLAVAEKFQDVLVTLP